MLVKSESASKLWRQKGSTSYLFMMLELFVNKVNLQPQFIVNIFLVVLKLTLNVFYLLFINLVWYTSQFMVAFLFAQISLQTMTKLQQAFKGVLSYCKLEFFLNVEPNFPILSNLKTLYPKILYLELFINVSVVSAMSPIMGRESGT